MTIVKAPSSDEEPSTEIGEILGKTDKNGDIKWDTGRKGDYSVALTKGETSVTHQISLTEDKKDHAIPLVFKEYSFLDFKGTAFFIYCRKPNYILEIYYVR